MRLIETGIMEAVVKMAVMNAMETIHRQALPNIQQALNGLDQVDQLFGWLIIYTALVLP